VPLPIDYIPSKEKSEELVAYKRMAKTDIYSKLKKLFEFIKKILKFEFLAKKKKKKIYKQDDDETLDWWSKYFASLEVKYRNRSRSCHKVELLLSRSSSCNIDSLDASGSAIATKSD